jgi:2-haloacid dehalogenase
MNAYVPFSKVTLQALQFACEQLGLPLTEKARVDLLQAYYQLSAFEDVPKEMVRLSQSYQLAVLSNADENMLQAALKNSDLASLFTKVLSVNALQRYKPDPWVYNLAVSQLGLQPPEIAFVSSNTWDVSGARAYGLFVCWLQRGGKVMDQLGQQPDMLIKNLSELG